MNNKASGVLIALGIASWVISLVYGATDVPEIILRVSTNILGVFLAVLAVGLEMQGRDK